MTTKTWNVRVHRGIHGSQDLGQVRESTEELARCAALSKFGISEEEAEDGTLRPGIYPTDDFDVLPT